MNAEIAQLDRPWTRSKVRVLLNGESKITVNTEAGPYQDVATGTTVYDMRKQAEEGGSIDLMDDVIQTDLAIDRLDPSLRKDAAACRARHDLTGTEITQLLGCKVDGDRLVEEAIGDISKGERLRGVEIPPDIAAPSCWRCMKRPVAEVGDDCGDTCPSLREGGRPQGTGIPVERMTLKQLIATQDADDEHSTTSSAYGGQIPGQTSYREKVVPATWADAKEVPENTDLPPRAGPVKWRAPQDLRTEGPVYPVRAWHAECDPED